MVNTFIDAITVALYEKFGESYKYYLEDVEQNVTKPCFVVGTLNPLVRSTSAKKYDRTLPIVIHYFTTKDNTVDAKKDCYTIAEQLLEALEYLNVSDCIVRGENSEWELVEGVLQFFITYRFEVRKTDEIYYMEEGTLNEVPM